MKKKIFSVCSLVAISMVSMLIACSKDNDTNNTNSGTTNNGCVCYYRGPNASDNTTFTAAEMDELGASSCSSLQTILNNDLRQDGDQDFTSVNCENR